jgi:hypothetical protein
MNKQLAFWLVGGLLLVNELTLKPVVAQLQQQSQQVFIVGKAMIR